MDHTCPRRAKGGVRTWGWCGPIVCPLLLPFGLLESSGVKLRKIVSDVNSENISCVAFLEPKTAENGNWHCDNFVNRLVAGNQ